MPSLSAHSLRADIPSDNRHFNLREVDTYALSTVFQRWTAPVFCGCERFALNFFQGVRCFQRVTGDWRGQLSIARGGGGVTCEACPPPPSSGPHTS